MKKHFMDCEGRNVDSRVACDCVRGRLPRDGHAVNADKKVILTQFFNQTYYQKENDWKRTNLGKAQKVQTLPKVQWTSDEHSDDFGQPNCDQLIGFATQSKIEMSEFDSEYSSAE